MDSQDFTEKLDVANDLMTQEKYSDAINILENLKSIEKQGEFDYNLTHRLYQLLSNAHSLFNQQHIFNIINKVSDKKKSITFQELSQLLEENEELALDKEIVRREIEILILRNQFSAKINGDTILF